MGISAANDGYRQRERATVLVIDDDEIIRSLVRLHLVSAGYDVTVAEDAVEGGYLILREQPDLVVCDVDMPYMGGYEFVAALKADPLTEQIPVIFLTVRGDLVDHAGRLGAVAYLRKPLTADRLVQTVDLYARRSLQSLDDNGGTPLS